jgi:thiamine biosynthesis lipoprotein
MPTAAGLNAMWPCWITRPHAAVLTLACLLCFGCDSATEDFRHQFYAFGTLVTIDFFDTRPQSNVAAMAAIEARIRELDRNWYPWRKHSDEPLGELQRINAAIAAGQAIEVSPMLAELVRRATDLEQLSGGRFNPAIGRLTELWGFHDLASLRASPPDEAEIRKWLSTSASSDSLEWIGNELRSNSPDVMLDLGGIAKGSILEQFVKILRDAGVENAIIDIGGDLTVLGHVNGRPARIGIRSPRSDDTLAWLDVTDGETVVTSGDYERFFEYEGRRYQHILDPRSGYPVQHTITATVLHQDPVLADAAATALLVAGSGAFEELCIVLGLDEALIVSASGDLRLTAAMEKRLNWTNR